MTPSPIRKIYQGIADHRQMFRMFDRHAQRPNRFEDDAATLYRGEWFEIFRAEHHYMFNVLPPLFMRGEMFALREFLTGRITSIFYELSIGGTVRHGNAGGPAVDAYGRVQSTIFAARVGGGREGGYGVPADVVRLVLGSADGPVSTGECAP